MKLRLYNGQYLRPEGGLADGEVWIGEDRIQYIGCKMAKHPAFDREIDLKGNVVLPGFKNAHTHSPMTFFRSFADDMKLSRWLNEKIFPLEAKLSGEDLYAFTKLAVAEYVSSGITSAFDMYFSADNIADAAADAGFRMVFCGAINNFSESAEQLEQQYIRLNRKNSLISCHLGFHAEYTTSLELLQKISELAHRYQAPVYTHNSETKAEVDECVGRYGLTPTALFEREGLFDFGGGGFHSVYMNETDFEIYKKRGVFAVTNPASNLKLASGIAPVCEFLRRDIPVAIGTDGAGSNNGLDMFREMYLTAVLQKYLENDAAACPADRVLEIAVANGARAMGLLECVSLAPGMKADLTVIDMSQPNMHPIHNTVKNIVYSGSKSNIALTMIDGKILYEKGEFFLDQDIEDIYRETQARTESLLKYR